MRVVVSSLVFSAAILGALSGAAPAQAQAHAQGPYSFDIVVNGQAQPMYLWGGRAYVAGVFGAAYEIRVNNRSDRRVEAVVAVDGRDVVTGQPIDPRRHRGHLVPAWATTSIAGFRSTESSVATFRFSTIPRSYAWRTGTAWGIGTIRVWVFEESVPEPIVVLPQDAPGAAQGRSSARAMPGAIDGEASAPRDMGTEYGEQRWSPALRTQFVRVSHAASAILSVRYQSQEALVAAGILTITPEWAPVVLYEDDARYDWYAPYPYAPPPPGYPYD